MNELNFIAHNFDPVYDQDSKILILGSFPSVISRENQFYYGNPRNRFWKLLAEILEQTVPETIEDKKEFLIRNRIAIYDAAKSCEIIGSSDSSMKSIEPSDLEPILKNSSIEKVFANGKKAHDIVKKHFDIDIVLLPSTSPANARYNLEQLKDKWKLILDYI
ncbi:MAG: DNA-deoxyinosine glycosylase [Andreesenia angusta]|nr:DNA-deoxyinosine glycosylase [Andreesenia angusta]